VLARSQCLSRDPTRREHCGVRTRELEAEAVACVVGEAVGVESVSAARDYIHLYRGDRDALCASFERIQRAASTILAAIDTSVTRAA